MFKPFDPREAPVLPGRDHVVAETPEDRDRRLVDIEALRAMAERNGVRAVFHWLLAFAAERGERLSS